MTLTDKIIVMIKHEQPPNTHIKAKMCKRGQIAVHFSLLQFTVV